MSGETKAQRVDVPALGLKPLALKKAGTWDPGAAGLFEKPEGFEKYFRPVLAFGPRDEYEMERIMPAGTMDVDPVGLAAELRESGNHLEAVDSIVEVLTADLRCLEAHAYLGNRGLGKGSVLGKRWIEDCRRHFQIGMEIGNLSLGNDFNGLLPGHIGTP